LPFSQSGIGGAALDPLLLMLAAALFGLSAGLGLLCARLMERKP
jgi:hypothetical protein